MKITWLQFVLIFITGSSQAKLGRRAQQQLLTLSSQGMIIQAPSANAQLSWDGHALLGQTIYSFEMYFVSYV